jgi:hypothetical protein
MEEAATPFPSEETTPPVTKIYFGAIHAARARDFPVRRAYQPSQRMTYKQLSSECAWLSNRTIACRNSRIQLVEEAENAKQVSKIARNFSNAGGFYDNGKV